MDYKNVKVIMCDVDGTLTKSDRLLSKRTEQMIYDLRKSGILFGLASGRPLEDTKKFYETWNIEGEPDIIISYNGCELWDKKTNTKQVFNYLKKEYIEEIFKINKQFEFANPQVYIPGILLVGHADEYYLGSAKRAHREGVVATNDKQFYENDNAKIMFRMDADKTPIMEAYWNSHPSNNYRSFKTQATMYEFTNPNSNKSVALIEYAKQNNLELNQIMSFGDNDNDIEMIECSLGVAMKNANESVKKVAKIILDKTNDEDGVADFVYKNILNN